MFLECSNNISDLIINKCHLIKKHQIYCLEKPNSIELYNMQLILNVENLLLKHISRKTLKTLNWNGKIYIPYLDE